MSKTAVAKTENTSLALPNDLLEQLAQDAKASAALERPSIGNISLRAGMLSYEGEPVKGNKLKVVILAVGHLHTFYSTPWDPDNPANPDCFALSEDGNDMAPHEAVLQPFSDKCATCPKFQWGTATRDGKPSKGKACSETRRLVLLPESALESVEDIAAAELAMVKLPVTSVKVWANYINSLAATISMPHYAVVTELSTQPDIKSQFKVVLTPVDKINDPDILRAIMAKRTEARLAAMVPFSANTEVAPASTTPEKF